MQVPTVFIGGSSGGWRIDRNDSVSGPGLPAAARLTVVEGAATGSASLAPGAAWQLRGVRSYERYVTRSEQAELTARSPELGRTEATRAALIPIAKSAAWWAMAQDERRAVFEDTSRHIATGLRYIPVVARRLYHGRDLGEPFDFLTWFEFAPGGAEAFEELVATLRLTEEWSYVEREVDIRLSR